MQPTLWNISQSMCTESSRTLLAMEEPSAHQEMLSGAGVQSKLMDLWMDNRHQYISEI